MNHTIIQTLLKTEKGSFYAFDIGILKNRVRWIAGHLPKQVDLCYAVKANLFLAKELENQVARFEVCSPGEAAVCRTLGIPSEKIVVSGVYKTPSVMAEMLADPAFCPVYTIESLEQYALLSRLAKENGRQISVLLRLTNGSQFGMNEEDIFALVRQTENDSPLRILGLQFFSGTQKQSVKKLRRELAALDALLLRLKTELQFTAEELEFGTGSPVVYFEGETFDEEAYFAALSETLCEMQFAGKITLELGRSIAASCGFYFTPVVDCKTNHGQNYALVDGGMHHIAYFGQYMAMKRPFLSVCGKEDLPPDAEWTICGSLCSMNDLLAKQVLLPALQVGDVLRFENTGAYCVTEGISLFLTRELPAVYLILENGEILKVRSTIQTAAWNTPQYGKKGF